MSGRKKNYEILDNIVVCNDVGTWNLSGSTTRCFYRLLTDECFRNILLQDYKKDRKNGTRDLLVALGNQVNKVDRTKHQAFNIYGAPVMWYQSKLSGEVLVLPYDNGPLQQASKASIRNSSLIQVADKYTEFFNLLYIYGQEKCGNDEWNRIVNEVILQTPQKIPISRKRFVRLIFQKALDDNYVYDLRSEVSLMIDRLPELSKWYPKSTSQQKIDSVIEKIREEPLLSLLALDKENTLLLIELLETSISIRDNELYIKSPLDSYRIRIEKEMENLCCTVTASFNSLLIFLGYISTNYDTDTYAINIENAKTSIENDINLCLSSQWKSLLNDTSNQWEKWCTALGFPDNMETDNNRLSSLFEFDSNNAIRFSNKLIRLYIMAGFDALRTCFMRLSTNDTKTELRSRTDRIFNESKTAHFDHLDLKTEFELSVYGAYYLTLLCEPFRTELIVDLVSTVLKDLSPSNRKYSNATALALVCLMTQNKSVNIPYSQFENVIYATFPFYTFPHLRNTMSYLCRMKPEYGNIISTSVYKACSFADDGNFPLEQPFFIMYSGLFETNITKLSSTLSVLCECDRRRAKSFSYSSQSDEDSSQSDEEQKKYIRDELDYISSICSEYINKFPSTTTNLNKTRKSNLLALSYAVSLLGYEISNLVRINETAFSSNLRNITRDGYTMNILKALIYSDELIRRYNNSYSSSSITVRFQDSDGKYYNVIAGSNLKTELYLPCGTYRAVSAIDWTEYLDDKRVPLKRNQKEHYMSYLTREEPRYGLLLYRLLAYTTNRENGTRSYNHENYIRDLVTRRYGGAEQDFLVYDNISNFNTNNREENISYLEDPKKLQKMS